MQPCLNRKNFFVVVLCAAVLCITVEVANCRTITVQADGTGDYPTIQNAIDASIDGDIIELQPGTYTGYGNRDIDFLGKAITVRSTDPNDADVVAATIIDCNANQFDRHHGFNFRSGEGPNSVVDGLTITNGYGKIVLVGCHLFASGGGGIFCYDSSPKIRNCVINNNSAVFGGGICCSCGSNATITNCTISGNSAEFGGGISCYDSNATITYCEVNNNYALGVSVGFGVVGDGGPAKGGGIYCIGRGNATTVRNCIVAGNKAVAGNGGLHGWHPGDGGNGYGGGICCDFKSEPKIENCTVIRNTVSGGNGGWILAIPPYRGGDGGNGYGGGISCSYQSKVTIRNCTVTDNATSGGRGAVDGQGYGAGICCESDGTGTMSNCILWSNSLEQIYGSETVTYSNVQGGLEGEGNIDTDPCFVEPGYWADANDPNIIVEPNHPNAVWVDGDYHLLRTSPCIDAGDPNYVAGPDETDLDGNPRVFGDRIDMGAYELFNTPPVACIVGGDKTVEAGSGCEARVTLDGSCSSDADSTPGTNDDINDFDWYDVVDVCDPNSDIYLGSGEIIECNLPLGEHTIILEVIDKAGAFDVNEVTIIVEDTTPPEFSLTVEPNVLWPPNHKMVKVTPSWEASDKCDELPEVTLVSITSNEDDDAKGDGHTKNDINVKGDGSIYLRAERSGRGTGRIYTITYRAVDDSGNVAVQNATVTVPHNRIPPWLRPISRGGLHHMQLRRLRHMLLRRLRSRVRRRR
jgi:hypothetical protein